MLYDRLFFRGGNSEIYMMDDLDSFFFACGFDDLAQFG